MKVTLTPVPRYDAYEQDIVAAFISQYDAVVQQCIKARGMLARNTLTCKHPKNLDK